MAFIVHANVPAGDVPELEVLRASARGRLEMPVHIDEETEAAAERGEREASWCPWPKLRVGLFVPDATTRGVELVIGREGGRIQARVTIPGLATWADWRLGLALCGALAEHGDGGVRVVGEGTFLPEGLEQMFEDDDERYLVELASGAAAVAEAVRGGRVARVGGPAGYAAIGTRTWLRLYESVAEPVDLPLALVEAIQDSIERRGYEGFVEANLMALEGRSGREAIVAVLPPGRDTILPDPEYVLLSDDLEAPGGEAGLFLLPFSELDSAFPAAVRWLDDRTAAMPAIPQTSWHSHLERLRGLTIPISELLDGPDDHPTRDADEPGPRSPWWKFW